MASEQQLVLDLFKRPFRRPTQEKEGQPIVLPEELSLVSSVSRGSVFSLFLKSHCLAAKQLCDYFMGARNVRELSLMAEKVRGGVNEYLFIYALAFVIIRKKEMRGVRIPNIVEVFPHLFMPIPVLSELEQKPAMVSTSEKMVITEYGAEFSGTHLKPENRVAYFREDSGINNHHWHWHLVYPHGHSKADRKGELFYYMHQQMVARYDMERLSVGLNRVEKLDNWHIPIPDGYFSKLTINNSWQAWGSRQDNTLMQDYKREIPSTDVADLELWHNRIMDAIHQGYFLDSDANQVRLSDDVWPPEKRGIDIVSDALESDSVLSANISFYGDLHNYGHMLISASHDPDYAHMENLGVMSSNITAVRDPVFYRWHKYIDDVFQEYKQTQLPYTSDQLSLSLVDVSSVDVESQGEKNKLTTGWNKKDLELSRGWDFKTSYPVYVRLIHLDHQPFKYNIEVTNKNQSPMKVTVRIFMAPKHNERGVDMKLSEQRLLWTEMDRFTYELTPGINKIVQPSTSSSVTNSKNDLTFRDLEKLSGSSDPEPDPVEKYCECGWPQHMLLPRGKEGGMPFQIFVMVTDWNKDKIIQPNDANPCSPASSFCGILNGLYPDARPMGFPFDRLFNDTFEKASDLAGLSNINLQDITITFTNDQI